MKIKFILLLLAGVAPFLMSTTTVKPLVQSDAVTSSRMLSVDQDFFINNTDGGEWVHFTGQLHLVTIFYPTDPIRIQTNVVSLKGVGESTGLTYGVTGATSFSGNYQPGSTNNSFTTSYRLLPPNPIQPISSQLHFGYLVSFDSFGGLTDASAEIVVVEEI